VVDHNLVLGDVMLMFRFLALHILAEDVREEGVALTQ
jgi:hypothetical protein